MTHSTHRNPIGIPQLKIGRDVRGRFSKGNKGGPGNPFARTVAALRKLFVGKVNPDKLAGIFTMLEDKALAGDLAAAKLFLQYVLGKPEPVKDPDRLDIDEWQRLQQMRVSEKQFRKTREDIPACLACHWTEYGWPCTVQEDGPLAETIYWIHHDLTAQDPAATSQVSTADFDLPEAESLNEQHWPFADSGSDAPDSDPPQAPPVNEPAETLTSQSHAPSEAPVPTPAGQPTHPSPGSERKSKEWRQPAREWRDGSHSSPEAPLPNGENDEEEEKALEHLRRVIEQYHQSQQSDSKPPGP